MNNPDITEPGAGTDADSGHPVSDRGTDTEEDQNSDFPVGTSATG